MEEGQGSKRADEAATAAEVQIEDVGSSSELSLSTASSAMLQTPQDHRCGKKKGKKIKKSGKDLKKREKRKDKEA
jgi:hypothetical protein